MGNALRTVAAIICVIAIVSNLLFVSFYSGMDETVPFIDNIVGGDDDDDGTDGNGDGGDGNGDGNGPGALVKEDIQDLSFTVPDYRCGDAMTYGFNLFVQMYAKGKDGYEDWSRYTLSAQGSIVWQVKDVTSTPDGFGNLQQAVPEKESLNAQFTITVESTQEGEENQPLEVSGNFNVARTEYVDITTGRAIRVETDGEVGIPLTQEMKDALQNIEIMDQSASEVEYDGDLLSFPDPNEDPLPTLDEQIWGNGQTLDVKSRGEIGPADNEDPYSFWSPDNYSWRSEEVDVVTLENFYSPDPDNPEQMEYAALRVNTTAKLLGWAEFSKVQWINESIPLPIRIKTRTNSSWDDENSEGYFIIKQDRTMSYDKYIQGDTEIPWENSDVTYNEEHTATDQYGPWESFSPESGSGYSFQVDPAGAVEYAETHSQNFSAFIKEHGRSNIMLSDCHYNETHGRDDTYDLQKGEVICRWNLTFSAYMSDKDIWDFYMEREEAREKGEEYPRAPSLAFTVTVKRQGTYLQRVGYNLGDMEIEDEQGVRYGYTTKRKSDFSSKPLTYAGSEDIMRSYDEFSDMFEDGKIDFSDEDITFAMSEGEVSVSNNPGVMMAQIITGITMPSASFSYGIQKGKIFAGGETLASAIDVGTGRMIFVMEISGTDLGQLLGGLG